MPTALKDKAKYKWPGILTSLGIAHEYLTGRHTACPICREGTDRFRFDDKDGDGTFYCNVCGAGDGFTLLQKVHDWDFPHAKRQVARLVDVTEAGPPKENKKPDRDKLRRIYTGIWRSASAGAGELAEYLEGRGLGVTSKQLRFHPSLRYFHDGKLHGQFPAMIAAIYGADGKKQSLHRTYLADVPERKKVMPPIDTIKGGAIRLFQPNGVLGVTEGIETALACYQIFKVPTWALISAENMMAFQWPKEIERLVVYGDCDDNYAGERAAFTLANKAASRGLDVEVMVPDRRPADWLDVLQEES